MSEQRLIFKSLDGLRGLAVMFVLLSHLSLHGINVAPWLDFSGFGKAGVYLFFCLSAFLLTYQALEPGQDNIKFPRYWAGYLVRRVCRIFPLYILVLIVALMLTTQTEGYGPKIPTVEVFFSHLLLQTGVSIYWAIPVEFTYYIALPVVCIALYLSARVSMWLSTLVLLVAMVAVHLVWPSSAVEANSVTLGPYLQLFFLGSFAGLAVSNGAIDAELANRPRCLGGLGWVALALIFLSVPTLWRYLFDPTASNKLFHAEFLGYSIAWNIVLVAALYGGVGFTRFFESAVWRFLGKISFSIYLWHLPIVQWIDRETSFTAPLQFGLAMLITLGIGFASYRVIERPVIAWAHQMTSTRRA